MLLNEKITSRPYSGYILLFYVMNPNEYINEKITSCPYSGYILLFYVMNPNELH